MSQKLGPKQQQWVEALRSGKYKQGKNVLRSADDCFCCLGVACDLFVSLEHVVKYRENGAYSYKGVLSEVPYEVLLSLKLRSPLGKIEGVDGEKSLAILNDKLYWNFQEIADFIEANPEKVFTEEA